MLAYLTTTFDTQFRLMWNKHITKLFRSSGFKSALLTVIQ